MDPENLPLVGPVFEFGAQDRVLDTIMLSGPVVVLAIVVLGRSPLTEALVVLYVTSFVAYVLYSGLRR
jgi:hypothetical protein